MLFKHGVGPNRNSAIHSNLLQLSTITPVKKSGLTVGCLNVQSARNKADLIRDIVIHHDIDILSLTETWLTTKDKDDFHVKGLSLPGNELNHTPRHGNHGYGGVGSLHKASIKIIKTDVYKTASETFNTGSRCLDLITHPTKRISSPLVSSLRSFLHFSRTKLLAQVTY